ncbi:MAG: hypothetical protein KH020_10685 [Clostridiales bacterium]|nr:hypothetical protein [Clostridiales bacterium]
MSEDNRLNEVIRVKKRPSNFVMMDKTFLEDERLSFKAKGILAYLLSKPDDWKVIVGNLVNSSKDGKASVYAGLKELKECGYYEKVPIRNEQGTRIIRWESTVYEVPISLLTDFQEIENQDIENQFIENRERNNNYNTNKLNITNNHVISSQSKADRCGSEKDKNDMTDVQAYESIIKKNIAYDDLLLSYPLDQALIDELVNIMLDTILSKGEYIRIGGEKKPRTLVSSVLLKLGYNNVEYVLEKYKSQQNRIQKKHSYLLSMLYHSAMETDAHYTNTAQADFVERENYG